MEVNTFFVDMDVLIPEQVVKNKDDSYTILLNSRLSHDRNIESYKHAIQHILEEDFQKKDADQIEFDAHSA